jgi:putative peptidoglycan lipid II flippase
MILTIVSKFIGFIREITLSYFYGASNISDAYLISLTIPTVIFGFLGAGISTSYIPIYSDILKKDKVKIANRFTNNIINTIIIFSTLIVILVFVFTAPIVRLFASGFQVDTLNLAITFTRITVFSVYFTGLGYVFRSYLQLNNRFILPAILGFVFNFFMIASIILSFKFKIIILAFGSVIALAAQVLLLLPDMYKNGYRFHFVLDTHDRYLRNMLILSMPVIIGNSVNQINRLVDRTLASQISVGGISALNYSNKLNTLILGIFVTSISTVMYPLISKMVADNNMNGLKKSLTEAVSGISLFVMPATVGSIVFSEPIVRLLFGRGAFDTLAISMTSNALVFYSIGIIGIGLREVLSRVFYSMQDAKTPMINAAIGMVLNIILNIVLSKYMGIGGLALATSIAAIITTGLMFISLRKKIGSFGMKQITISFFKILFASLIMGLLAKLGFNYLNLILSQNLSLLFAIILGVISYFILIYFMRIDDVDAIIKSFKDKLTKIASR